MNERLVVEIVAKLLICYRDKSSSNQSLEGEQKVNSEAKVKV